MLMWSWVIRVGKDGDHVLIDVLQMCGVQDTGLGFLSCMGRGAFFLEWGHGAISWDVNDLRWCFGFV